MIDTDRCARICGAKLEGGELLPKERNNFRTRRTGCFLLFPPSPARLESANKDMKGANVRMISGGDDTVMEKMDKVTGENGIMRKAQYA